MDNLRDDFDGGVLAGEDPGVETAPHRPALLSSALCCASTSLRRRLEGASLERYEDSEPPNSGSDRGSDMTQVEVDPLQL